MKLPIVNFGENETPAVDVTAAFLGKVKGLESLRDFKMDAKASPVKNVKSFERNVETRVLGLCSRKVDKKQGRQGKKTNRACHCRDSPFDNSLAGYCDEATLL